jgi:hypothetical protein
VPAEAETVIDVELAVEYGAKLAVRPCGKFVKFRYTDELNPPIGMILKGMPLTLCPADTVWSLTAVNAKSAPKLAVTLLGTVMVTFPDVAVPVRSPLKPVNGCTPVGLALTVTTSPLLCHPLPGPIFPNAAGLAVVVKKYCVVKLAV